MTTAIASDYTAPTESGKANFLLRRLHSLTGILFGGYVIIHLLVNATLIEGARPDIYQFQVEKIHRLPFLAVIEWVFIYLPILYHTVYGIYIIATGQPNVGRYGYEKNWLYTLQRLSGLFIIVWLLFHVLALKYGVFGEKLGFDAERATATIAMHLDHWFLLWIWYPIGVLLACFHLANGFWTAGITWGLTVSAGAQRRWGYVCAVLFAFTVICGLLALIGGAQAHP